MGEVTTKKKFGGQQEGSGRPKKDATDKFPKVKITMTPEHYAATAGDRSGMVRRALDGMAELARLKDLLEIVRRYAVIEYGESASCRVIASEIQQAFPKQPSGANEIEK